MAPRAEATRARAGVTSQEAGARLHPYLLTRSMRTACHRWCDDDPPERYRPTGTQCPQSREMAGVLVRYGLADWLRQIPGSRLQEWLRDAEGHTIADLSMPERIRLALTELGTTFIKLGQMLGTTARSRRTGPRSGARPTAIRHTS